MITDSKTIMNFDHPFNQTIINDNSVIPDPQSSVPERVNYLNVFIGGKGRDNKLIKKTSKSDFVKEYGKPNSIKYGQPILNAYASIVDQFSHAYCMRVMPLDACYSNVIMYAKYKVNDENKLEIKIEAKSEGDFKNVSQFESLVDKITNTEADEQGFFTTPLFGIRSLGRGKYGNSYRVRLTNVFHKSKTQNYREYRLELLDIDEGNTVVESFQGTLFDLATNGRSLLLSDVLDQETNGSERISIYVNEEAFEDMYEKYKTVVSAEKQVSMYNFDPIFGVNNDKKPQEGIKISEGVALDRLDGVPLLGGTEGALENPPHDKSHDEVVEDLYIKAFAGELDRAILSSRRIPVKFILDANYPLNVKRQIVQLGLKRYDALIHLDAGLLNTNDEAILFGEETSDINYRIVSKSYQHYQIRDPFTGKRIPVTMTYDYATNLARHIETYGVETPYTGESFARLNGAIKGSLQPVLDESDEEMKERLYDLRLNYYEAVAENVHARATQQTSQDVNSDLSEENNMLITLEIKDIAERETIARRYNFAEPEDRALFTDLLNEKIKHLKNVVRNIDLYYDMSSSEEARSIIHCYISVVFKTMAKSSIIEININKRV